jgi:hypothetical protein
MRGIVNRVSETRERTELDCDKVTSRLFGRPCDRYVFAIYRHHVFMTIDEFGLRPSKKTLHDVMK